MLELLGISPILIFAGLWIFNQYLNAKEARERRRIEQLMKDGAYIWQERFTKAASFEIKDKI
jgi:hypothetical protein